MNKIEETLRNFTNRKEIAGAAVLVRKEGRIVEDFSYGYGDIEKKCRWIERQCFVWHP